MLCVSVPFGCDTRLAGSRDYYFSTKEEAERFASDLEKYDETVNLSKYEILKTSESTSICDEWDHELLFDKIAIKEVAS